jgi:ATP-dependent DNA ligase
MTPTRGRRTRSPTASPGFIPPQLATLVKQAPDGPAWLHEIKLDGYRMAARLDNADVRLLTRTGLDWTTKYPVIAEALSELPATTAYLDGELCGVLSDGRTAFNLIQNAADTRNTSLVFFLFDLLFLDGEDLRGLPLIGRKARLATLLADAPSCLQFTDHQLGRGPTFTGWSANMALRGSCRSASTGRTSRVGGLG